MQTERVCVILLEVVITISRLNRNHAQYLQQAQYLLFSNGLAFGTETNLVSEVR